MTSLSLNQDWAEPGQFAMDLYVIALSAICHQKYSGTFPNVAFRILEALPLEIIPEAAVAGFFGAM